MTLIYTLISICVAFITIAGVFLKLAYHMGQMAQQLKAIAEGLDTVTKQVSELFEWRYKSAVRNQKGRGRLPGD